MRTPLMYFTAFYSFYIFSLFVVLIPCEPDQARTDKLIFLEFKLGEKSHDYSLLHTKRSQMPYAIRTHYFCCVTPPGE